MGDDNFELSARVKNELYEYIRPKVQLCAVVIAVAISLLIATISFSASNIANRNSTKAVESISRTTAIDLGRYREELDEFRTTADSTIENVQQSMERAELNRNKMELQTVEIKESVAEQIDETRSIAATLDALTTDQIVSKLNDAEARITLLTEKLDNLQSLIDPEKAEDIFNAAQIRKELSTRKEFEKNFSADVNARFSNQTEIRSYYEEYISANMEGLSDRVANLSNKVANSENNLPSLFYWILGIFASVVASLIAALVFFAKNIVSSLNLIVKSNETVPENTDANNKRIGTATQ